MPTDHHRRAARRPAQRISERAASRRRADMRTRGRRCSSAPAGHHGDRHHDDAHAQPLARRQDHRDIGPAAPSLARHQEHDAAADDAGGAVRRAGLLLHRRPARAGRADRDQRADDGLCADRLCRAAHADAGAEEPRGSGSAHLCDHASRSIWPLLAMVILGLADAIFGFRERFLRGRPPPLPAS